MLIVTWDEHGGFFDHAVPPRAEEPGDAPSVWSKFGCNVEQYGAHVPAVIVTPLNEPNRIDGRLYDHASIPATLEALFGMKALTRRDAAANSVLPLAKLSTPRETPQTLPPA